MLSVRSLYKVNTFLLILFTELHNAWEYEIYYQIITLWHIYETFIIMDIDYKLSQEMLKLSTLSSYCQLSLWFCRQKI